MLKSRYDYVRRSFNIGGDSIHSYTRRNCCRCKVESSLHWKNVVKRIEKYIGGGE